MAGLYIHIPFCKKRCFYCDFYSTTTGGLKPYFIDAVIKEIHLRKNYLPVNNIDTVYFGGGTPSILSRNDFCEIFNAINEVFILNPSAEITLEANPDDLSLSYLSILSNLPFNRLSIGIQSFNDRLLTAINRRHSSKQATESVKNAKKAGFENISIDLIYGLPYQSLDDWKEELTTAFDLGVQHISAYGLTYESGTVLNNLLEQGKIESADDDLMIEMYRLLNNQVEENGFKRYEISNFSLPQFESKHNSSYWQNTPFIGIGPSAHSYNGTSRQWNVSSLMDYINSLKSGILDFEQENLSLSDKYNDRIMISLRTAKGLDVQKLEEEFGTDLKKECLKNIQKYIETNKVIYENGFLSLTLDGIMVSDHIISSLIKV